jgi:aspartate/methionine/tyrosine aminotransferase
MSLENNGRVLSVFGFSKSFSIAGLRAGCIYCTDPGIFERLVAVSGVMTTAGGVASLTQIAALACVEQCYYWVDEFRAYLTGNRDYALSRIREMPGITCHKPQATFVLFCDVSAFGMPSVELTNYLRDEHKLALVPGGVQYFGPGSEGYLRISLATSREILAAGLDRMEVGLRALAVRRGV